MLRGEFCAGPVAGSDRSHLFGGELAAPVLYSLRLSISAHHIRHVFTLCIHNQVVRVNAAWIIAGMPYDLACGITTIEQTSYTVRSPLRTLELENTVAVFIPGGLPLPARISRAYLNLIPEPVSVLIRDLIK